MLILLSLLGCSLTLALVIVAHRRAELERQLRAERDFALQVMRGMGEGLTVTDSEQRFTFVNDAYARLCGYSPAELIGRSPLELTSDEAQATLLDADTARLQGRTSTYTSRLKRADGSTAIVQITGAPRIVDGKAAGTVAVVTDLSERVTTEAALREAEAALRRQKTLLEAQSEASPDGILVVGPDGDWLYHNRRFIDLWGISPQVAAASNSTVARASVADRVADPQLFYQRISAIYADPETISTDQVIMRDGRVLECYSAPVRDPAGTYEGRVWYYRDITERERAAADLLRAKEAAESAARAQAAFLAAMSHEIRTPMNGVLGMASLLDGTALSAEQRTYTATLRRSGEALLTIIDDILDFSKIESGRVDLEEISFDLHTLVADVGDLFADAAARNGLSLSHRVGDGVPAVLCGDPTRLRQILTNLLANAIKFTERGAVALTVAQAEQHAAVPTDGSDGAASAAPLRPGDEYILFSVSDTGIGIAPEVQRQIFAPFTQADRSTTRLYGGTGLGLSICKQLATLMGGAITLQSAPGQGSTFTLWLPLVPGDPAVLAAAATPPRPAARASAHILIAEDNAVNQLVAEQLLARMGHRTTTVSDGRAAVAAMADGRYDLVLMDCHMPELDGFDATTAIRAAEGMRHTPIVALTASASAGERERCLAAGMDDYLAKPITSETLAATLTRWLPAML